MKPSTLSFLFGVMLSLVVSVAICYKVRDAAKVGMMPAQDCVIAVSKARKEKP